MTYTRLNVRNTGPVGPTIASQRSSTATAQSSELAPVSRTGDYAAFGSCDSYCSGLT